MPNYRRWIRDIEELQTVKMNFSLMADPDCAVLASVSDIAKITDCHCIVVYPTDVSFGFQDLNITRTEYLL